MSTQFAIKLILLYFPIAFRAIVPYNIAHETDQNCTGYQYFCQP